MGRSTPQESVGQVAGGLCGRGRTLPVTGDGVQRLSTTRTNVATHERRVSPTPRIVSARLVSSPITAVTDGPTPVVCRGRFDPPPGCRCTLGRCARISRARPALPPCPRGLPPHCPSRTARPTPAISRSLSCPSVRSSPTTVVGPRPTDSGSACVPAPAARSSPRAAVRAAPASLPDRCCPQHIECVGAPTSARQSAGDDARRVPLSCSTSGQGSTAPRPRGSDSS